jgi:hypothetical protein
MAVLDRTRLTGRLFLSASFPEYLHILGLSRYYLVIVAKYILIVTNNKICPVNIAVLLSSFVFLTLEKTDLFYRIFLK